VQLAPGKKKKQNKEQRTSHHSRVYILEKPGKKNERPKLKMMSQANEISKLNQSQAFNIKTKAQDNIYIPNASVRPS